MLDVFTSLAPPSGLQRHDKEQNTPTIIHKIGQTEQSSIK
jgi:hypothetical protein